jgi:hypothetical protein
MQLSSSAFSRSARLSADDRQIAVLKPAFQAFFAGKRI